METIHESKQKVSGPPGVLPEAALFSVVKPNQWTTDVVVSATMGNLTGRSSSLRTPLSRKTSFRVREWTKRSNSSRTTPSTGLSASESLKSHIKHLGGGRLDQVEVQGTANNTTLLAPFPARGLRRRASSIDSRTTQWLDFYTSTPEASKSPSKSPSKPQPKPGSLDGDDDREPQGQRQRAGSNSDLRPAPLRVPSSERQRENSGAANTSPKPLGRKDSKWKPLPTLPAQRASVEKSATGTMTHDEDGTASSSPRAWESDPAATSSPLIQEGDHSSQLDNDEPRQPLPTFRFDSPPPTPDSSAGGAARVHADHLQDQGRQKDQHHQSGTATTTDAPTDSKTSQGRHQPVLAAAVPAPKPAGVRHTRRERVWLHVNYRGEAPFLWAWGLDIARLSDRLEGLVILRELMQAEDEEEENDEGGRQRRKGEGRGAGETQGAARAAFQEPMTLI
ncbi:hypothetical protein C7999DRAFT_16272 [Corynascus novoguineensis]|uniref:Uncharacterized protein n=1 Tax=Corynascus novoguineensis TaxID=1126955 RepID=A0AAN7HL58_9PEZI|nr:hypothetical protein C7999DRAFT_16272 [Corynascus novoguineensis]